MEKQFDGFKHYLDNLLPQLVSYAGNILLALIVLFIGLTIIRAFEKGLHRVMTVRKMEPTLQGFVLSVLGLLLKALLFISVASMVGIATTSFVAVLGAAGLAVGMALQGSLANFAGGVLILLFRPFKVGDSIVSGSAQGTVVSIEMFRTVLRSLSNEILYVPNGELSNKVVINSSAELNRLGKVSLVVDYADDTDQARQILLGLLQGDSRVLESPAPAVAVSPCPTHIQVDLVFWTASANILPLQGEYGEKAIKALKAAGFRLGVDRHLLH